MSLYGLYVPFYSLLVLQNCGNELGELFTLTAPFVLSVWLTMGIKKKLYLLFKLGRKQATNPNKGIKAHTL